MTSSDERKHEVLDAAGKPIPRKATFPERVRSTTLKTKAIVGSCIGALAVVAAVVTNLDKVAGLFGAAEPKEAISEAPANSRSGTTTDPGNLGSESQGSTAPTLAERGKNGDFSNSSVLAFQAYGEDFGYASRVQNSWDRPRVENVSAESSKAFRSALNKACEVVHLSIGFDDKAVWFSEHDIVSTVKFRDMFVAAGTTRLLILDGCGSFAIGKVLEDAGLDYLIVALPDAPSANMFFDSLYLHLSKGVKPPEAVERAKAEVRLAQGNPDDFSCTTY